MPPFEAQLQLESGNFADAHKTARKAMVSAARALVKSQFHDVPDDPDTIVSEFRSRFYDTELFFDPFAKGKFAHYLFRAHEDVEEASGVDKARQVIEEAQLFIEAAHGCYGRMDTVEA